MGRERSMYWLNIVLFSILDSEDEESNNYVIARYLLENYDHLSGATLSDISEQCNVSKAAISRFCKKIGLLDYIDLQMLIRERHNATPKRQRNLSISEQKVSFYEAVDQANRNLAVCMDNPFVEQLIEDILAYRNICLFGHLQASHIAYTLRNNLAVLSKLCYCTQNWVSQKDKLYHATNDDLFIIFSSTGDYFKRIDINMNRLEQSGAKIYLVTFDRNESYGNDFVTKITLGDESGDPFSNIVMNMFVNYISYRLSYILK